MTRNIFRQILDEIEGSDTRLVVQHAIEILDGSGTIEEFSPLYRERPIQESSEGSHSTLTAQLLRDAIRSKARPCAACCDASPTRRRFMSGV